MEFNLLFLNLEHIQPQVKKKKRSSYREREKEDDSGRIYERSLEQRIGRRKKGNFSKPKKLLDISIR